MTLQLKPVNYFFQFIIKETKKTTTTEELVADDVYLLISSFLNPKDFILFSLTNRHLYQLCSSDFVWKDIFEQYSCYLPNTTPRKFGVCTYKELFMLKTWKLSTKNKSKGIKLQKNLRTVSNSNKTTIPTQVRLITTEEGLLHGKRLIRVRFDEKIYGCFVGIISKLNMNNALKSEKKTYHSHLRYMRDGSIGGVQRIYNETIDRIRYIGDEKRRVYFCCEKNDVLSIYLNMDQSNVKFVVNDDPKCMITVSNIREMKLGSPIHLIFGLPCNQKFTILDNIKNDINDVLAEVRTTESCCFNSERI
eukprot:gene10270-2689_t